MTLANLKTHLCHHPAKSPAKLSSREGDENNATSVLKLQHSRPPPKSAKTPVRHRHPPNQKWHKPTNRSNRKSPKSRLYNARAFPSYANRRPVKNLKSIKAVCNNEFLIDGITSRQQTVSTQNSRLFATVRKRRSFPRRKREITQ